MAQQLTSSPTLLFAPIQSERLGWKSWLAAIVLGLVLVGLGSKLLDLKGKQAATEDPLAYTGGGLVNSHQIVNLVQATITLKCSDKALSQQIAETLAREDRSGAFESAEDSRALATLLTTEIRDVSHDNRFQVMYSLTPPDLSQAHGRAFFRISEHLSVGLPSE